MNPHDVNEINRLIGQFTDLQESWESDPGHFDWHALEALARDGAQAYNEGNGPSFHALALDAVRHGEFHERFLAWSLQAGFDPFKLSRPGSTGGEVPVIDHADLADAAESNPSSARMRAMLMELARARFAPLADDFRSGRRTSASWQFRVIEACAESVPRDVLEDIAPELVRPHHGEVPKQKVDPVEGYLSSAEVMVDSNTHPYG